MKTKKQKPMDALKWLDLARDHDKNAQCEWMTTPLSDNAGNTYACDGWRWHEVKDQVLAPFAKESEYMPKTMPAGTPESVITVKRDTLLDALQVCRSMAIYNSKITRFSVNGRLDVSAQCDENDYARGSLCANAAGDVRAQILTADGYTHDGVDLEISVNCDFMRDAVKGMGETVEIEFWGTLSPMLVSSPDTPERSALIMPMHVER